MTSDSVPRAVASEAFSTASGSERGFRRTYGWSLARCRSRYRKDLWMEPRSLPLAVLKGLMDGASFATALNTGLSIQVEIFSAKYFPLCVFSCWRYVCAKTSDDP